MSDNVTTLADADGHPSKNNLEIIKATGNPLFTSELAKFNMEINGNPLPLFLLG